jgi:hypothetical protein
VFGDAKMSTAPVDLTIGPHPLHRAEIAIARHRHDRYPRKRTASALREPALALCELALIRPP